MRRDAGISAYEAALARAGFTAVAGADEAGRGACAGPLVVAACVLPPGSRGRIEGLTDSKLLTAATRERLYEQVVRRAVSYAVVIVPAAEIDAYGLHVANLAGMRRAIGQLNPASNYALTDGFPVQGLGVPSTAVWKGDATVGCIAAASILAKVTRDAILTEMHDQWPEYEFAKHKGYITATHTAALERHGPCPQHRRRYVNVRRALGLEPGAGLEAELEAELDGEQAAVVDNGADPGALDPTGAPR
ncbi:ribonuclease HII [Jatrophihabitans sp.]|uniref:ribonuclease HII n=1 Tax=Jatrophihabitans sp. TaxID=1932789 RepID=UPI0030C68208|nr:ribonuclease [Jatrophihabitans sp.]